MEKPATVSVIIPFYNCANWLCEAVESVLNQTYPILEIIVINDGSSEDVSSFLEKYGNSITYIFKENGGPATARNLGIEKASGDYIAFLDSDDLWFPEKTEVQITMMLESKVKWSHTAYETFNTIDNRTVKKVDIGEHNGMIFPMMLYSNPLATPGIIIKRDIFIENPSWRFNKEMRYGQDQYLWMCIAPKHKILAINNVLVRVRMRGSNAALRARVQLRAKAIIYDNILKPIPNNLCKVSKSGSLAFKLCVFGERILTKVESKTKNDSVIETIARVLYLVPWFIFKSNYKKTIKKDRII